MRYLSPPQFAVDAQRARSLSPRGGGVAAGGEGGEPLDGGRGLHARSHSMEAGACGSDGGGEGQQNALQEHAGHENVSFERLGKFTRATEEDFTKPEIAAAANRHRSLDEKLKQGLREKDQMARVRCYILALYVAWRSLGFTGIFAFGNERSKQRSNGITEQMASQSASSANNSA